MGNETTWVASVLLVAMSACGESQSAGRRHGNGGSSGSAGSGGSGFAGGGTAGMAGSDGGAGTGGSAGAPIGPADFTLPPLPDRTASDLAITSENEALFYKAATLALFSFFPSLHVTQLSEAGLLPGNLNGPGMPFVPTTFIDCARVLQGDFGRLTCAMHLSEYRSLPTDTTLTLESRAHQGLDPTRGMDPANAWDTEQVVEYSLVEEDVVADWRYAWDTNENGALVWWMRASASFSVSSNQWAQAGLEAAFGPERFLLPYLYEDLDYEVHLRALAPTTHGIMYQSLVGFEAHFTLTPVLSATDFGFRITAANDTSRCFYGEEMTSEPPSFYFWSVIRTDADCDGVSEGTLVTSPD